MNEAACIKIEIDQDSPLWAGAPFAEDAARRVVAAALADGGLTCRDGAELSILLTDDARIRALNAAWRGQDKATNVLSFPAVEPGMIATAPLLGDIVIAYETVEREARAQSISFRNHYVHLLVHGFLHLFGYDHLTEIEAAAMERLESEILHRLGIEDPYAGTIVTREAS
jgi:probable rRNA maturation factor